MTKILNVLTYENVENLTFVLDSGRVITIRPEQVTYPALRNLVQCRVEEGDTLDTQILEILNGQNLPIVQPAQEEDTKLFDVNTMHLFEENGVVVYKCDNRKVEIHPTIADELMQMSDIIKNTHLEWEKIPDDIKGLIGFIENVCQNTRENVRNTLFELYLTNRVSPRPDGSLSVLDQNTIAKTVINDPSMTYWGVYPPNITSITHDKNVIKVMC